MLKSIENMFGMKRNTNVSRNTNIHQNPPGRLLLNNIQQQQQLQHLQQQQQLQRARQFQIQNQKQPLSVPVQNGVVTQIYTQQQNPIDYSQQSLDLQGPAYYYGDNSPYGGITDKSMHSWQNINSVEDGCCYAESRCFPTVPELSGIESSYSGSTDQLSPSINANPLVSYPNQTIAIDPQSTLYAKQQCSIWKQSQPQTQYQSQYQSQTQYQSQPMVINGGISNAALSNLSPNQILALSTQRLQPAYSY